jgi:hypothetical protein
MARPGAERKGPATLRMNSAALYTIELGGATPLG